MNHHLPRDTRHLWWPVALTIALVAAAGIASLIEGVTS